MLSHLLFQKGFIKMKNIHNAFTMIELVFVIVILGILTAVAVPKFGAVFQDAYNSKAAETVAAIRSSILNERQRRIMTGGGSSYTPLLDDARENVSGESLFDGNATVEMLMYPVYSGSKPGKWMKISDNSGDVIKYRYYLRNGEYVDFNYTKATGKFDCDHSDDTCKYLTE